jgi:hypothetical protein
MKFQTHEYDIGAHFLSALIDGDASGLDDNEETALDAWEADIRAELGATGFWTTVDGHDNEFSRCDITGLRSDTSRVAYMVPPTD